MLKSLEYIYRILKPLPNLDVERRTPTYERSSAHKGRRILSPFQTTTTADSSRPTPPKYCVAHLVGRVDRQQLRIPGLIYRTYLHNTRRTAP